MVSAVKETKNQPTQSQSNRARRTNQQRTTETKEKVIKAAIACISDVGYEGTSIKEVATRAGVSKGATQHHYPTKVDLMVAVADYCLKLHTDIRKKIYEQFVPGPDRISHTAESSWTIINHPSYTALIEIMMATRNSQELKKRAKPLLDYITLQRQYGEDAFCEDFGVEPNPLVKALIRTHVTAMRGIAVGMMFHPDKESFRQELDLMQEYERLMTQIIIEKHGKNKN